VAVTSAAQRRPRTSLERLEPAVPLFLGLHGLATMLLDPGSAPITVGFAGICVLGLAGLAGWCSTRAVVLRATACLALALAAQLREPELVPAMLQWYYCVGAIYSLLMTGRRAALVGPLTAACYFAQVLFGSAPVPLAVAALRSGVLAALGLVMYLAGRSYRQARSDAERGQARAETAGRQLAHAAAHDALTDLPNRSSFLAGIDRALADGRTSCTALVLDIDRFKSVNDALGHESGDRMLVEVAERLTQWASAARAPGVLCLSRLGGDAFGVLLDAPAGDSAAAAERLLQAFVAPFSVDGRQLSITVSIGAATTGPGGSTATEVLRAADVALFEAKADGRNRVSEFDTSMSQGTQRTLSLEQDLRAAVRAGEIRLHFQPIVAVASGEISGVEALARWTRPGEGPVPPDVFIAVAESLGLIGDLGQHVLATALDALTGWRGNGLPLTYVAVNVSPLQLRDPAFAETVAALLAARGLPPSSLVLEVTEGAVMEASPVVAAVLGSLRTMGVSLSMDDFGTGYSSLARLGQLPVSEIKVDRSFIAELPEDDTMTRIVLELATRFGLHTVAEGVESADQLASLRRLGCDFAQGYHLHRPLPPEEVPALFAPGAPAASGLAAART
jgi:diguanylate cyclase (GGDEF)-like protein